jgi:CRISPR-associated endonuclease Csn1
MQSHGVRTPGEWLHRLQQGEKNSSGGPTIGSTTPSDRAGMHGMQPHFERSMIEREFDLLWARQQQAMPRLCHPRARAAIRDTLFFERGRAIPPPGRCLLMPQEARAPAALPSAQRLRILLEVNTMQLRSSAWSDSVALTQAQRSTLLEALERSAKMTFSRMRELLDLPADAHFSGQGSGRQDIQGNATSALLSKANLFGKRWGGLTDQLQDEIVERLLADADEADLLAWLRTNTGIDEDTALRIARAPLPSGHGPLSRRALAQVLPHLCAGCASLRDAAGNAGLRWPFEDADTPPEVAALPPYDEALLPHRWGAHQHLDGEEVPQRGRVADPRLHIGLNQVRLIVNALVERYGRPAEIHAQVARLLKRSARQRQDDARRSRFLAAQQERLRALAADRLAVEPQTVNPSLVQQLQLWEELAEDEHARRCPCSGTPITLDMVLGGEAVADHILPFALTLDDSSSNKTLTTRSAWLEKGEQNPRTWSAIAGTRAGLREAEKPKARAGLPAYKLARMDAEGLQRWLRGHPDAISKALDDDYAASHLLRRYLQHLCPNSTRVLGGRQTALLRRHLGLDDALGREGARVRDDYRHHAIDACIVGITDAALLRRLSACAALAPRDGPPGLLVGMQPPWPTFQEHVRRAVQAVWVSHKPEHGHEGAMHRDTAYGLRDSADPAPLLVAKGQPRNVAPAHSVIRVADANGAHRHGTDAEGRLRAYKGYKTDSNYCVEIVRDAEDGWQAEVVSTYDAYEAARRQGAGRLRDAEVSLGGKPLVMRLTKGDCVRVVVRGELRLMRVRMLARSGRIHLCGHNEADARRRLGDGDPSLLHCELSASGLKKAQARRVTVTPLGLVRDPGFSG